jgi:hypothetical protein
MTIVLEKRVAYSMFRFSNAQKEKLLCSRLVMNLPFEAGDKKDSFIPCK